MFATQPKKRKKEKSQSRSVSKIWQMQEYILCHHTQLQKTEHKNLKMWPAPIQIATTFTKRNSVISKAVKR